MTARLEGLARDREAHAADLERSLRLMLAPRDPNDEKDVIMEVRAAVGGDEAGMWAGELFRMYQRYTERHRWAVGPMNTSPSDSGGFKEITFAVKGRGAYSRLKFQAGPHPVQRVPRKEAQGRIRTSIATVAVLPEVEEVEVEIAEGDLQIDVFRSTEPSWRAGRGSRHSRRSQVGRGKRAEKMRTCNFRENRVTDHRIGLTIKRLLEILEGDLDDFVDALTLGDEARRLAEVG